MALARAMVAALKRLDTVVAAALIAIGLTPVPAGWVCAEASCQSARDRVALAAFTLASAIAIAALLWRITRRWWSRAVALPLAAYAAVQLWTVLRHHGRWSVVREDGTNCAVRAGTPQNEIRRACGAPAYRCEGPKFVDSGSFWNPLELEVCGFMGDVYRARLVIYDCRGRVALVEGFDRARPGCWILGR